jgi:hypothetical protein
MVFSGAEPTRLATFSSNDIGGCGYHTWHDLDYFAVSQVCGCTILVFLNPSRTGGPSKFELSLCILAACIFHGSLIGTMFHVQSLTGHGTRGVRSRGLTPSLGLYNGYCSPNALYGNCKFRRFLVRFVDPFLEFNDVLLILEGFRSSSLCKLTPILKIILESRPCLTGH